MLCYTNIMFVQHNFFEKSKFIDGIDKTAHVFFCIAICQQLPFPLNDVFVAYVLGYMRN